MADDGLNIPPGQVFAAPVDADASDTPVSVIRPGETIRHPAGLVEASAQGATIRYDDTNQAGVYRRHSPFRQPTLSLLPRPLRPPAPACPARNCGRCSRSPHSFACSSKPPSPII